MKLLTTYTSFKNLNGGDFILMRSHDLDVVHVWMGKSQSDVVKVKEIEVFKMLKVQWWVPMKKGINLDERHLYENCWNGKWKFNFVDIKQWLHIFLFFRVFSLKNVSNKSHITIPSTYLSKV